LCPLNATAAGQVMGLFRRKKAKTGSLSLAGSHHDRACSPNPSGGHMDGPFTPPDGRYDYTYKLHLAGGHIGGTDGDRQSTILGLRPGQTLELVREPHNRHDKNAVAVYAADKQVGYVPGFKAEMTARYLDQQRTVDARVVALTDYVPASKAEQISYYLSRGCDDEARAALAWCDNSARPWCDLFGVLMWLGFRR
jgi:hypothetical protein